MLFSRDLQFILSENTAITFINIHINNLSPDKIVKFSYRNRLLEIPHLCYSKLVFSFLFSVFYRTFLCQIKQPKLLL